MFQGNEDDEKGLWTSMTYESLGQIIPNQIILETGCLAVEMLWAEDPVKQENSPWTGKDS